MVCVGKASFSPNAFEIEARMGGLRLKGRVGDVVLERDDFPIYIFEDECGRKRSEVGGEAKQGK